MLQPPKTTKEAQTIKYGAWAGFPAGHRYDPKRCAYECIETRRGGLFYQCTRKNGKGPANLYCGQHAKVVGGAI